jgi:ABC-type branched-subunit amino acid transport system ATPase component
VALGVAALFALATGIVCLRTKGVYFIMITLAFGQMLFFIATSLAPYGGDDGLTIRVRSTLAGLPIFASDRALYYVCLACLLGTYLLCRALIVSRFGRVYRGARENALRLGTIGFEVYRFQLVMYVIAGMMAGLAGFLLGNATDFVSPAYMAWQRSGDLLIMVILGRHRHAQWRNHRRGRVPAHRRMAVGAHRALEGHLRAAAGGGRGLRARRADRHGGQDCGGCSVADPVLRIEGLTKNFGGLRVTDDVTLEVRPGELHAVIGPNGAGKTTLINQISGLFAPDAGRIVFAARTSPPAGARARARGLARSFQITSILPRFLGAGERRARRAGAHGSSFRFFGRAATRRLNAPALRRSRRSACRARDVPAGDLSHGEKRALELAIALAMEPKLLLLDEPMAGHRPRRDRAAGRGAALRSRAAFRWCWSSTT